MRLTAFPSPSAQIDKPNWWEHTVGEAPEKRVSRLKRGGQQEEGPFEGGKLILNIQPTRIDWLFTVTKDKEEDVEEIPTIGSFTKSLNPFLQLMLKWLSISPPLQRLAFGAILLQPVDDLETGYRLIATYLPFVQLDSEGSSDFFYQINRPRNSMSGITGLEVNRLSKWSITRWQTSDLSLPAMTYFPGKPYFACCLELDINTAVDFSDELIGEQLPRVFQELVNLGLEIAREGDTK